MSETAEPQNETVDDETAEPESEAPAKRTKQRWLFDRSHTTLTPGDLALAIQLRNAATHLGADLDEGHVAQQHGRGAGERNRDRAELVQRLEEPARSHHVLGFGEFHHGTARGLVGPLQAFHHHRLRHTQRSHPLRIEDDLVLADHPAYARYLGDIGNRLQFELQEPVVQGAQLADVMAARAVHQRVFVDPAHARGIGTERGRGSCGQTALHLVQVLHHPGPRPVGVGLVVEQDIDEGVTEEGVAAYRLRARYAQHRGGERIGHEVLHHLRRLAGIGGPHDHLRVRQVREGVDRSPCCGPETRRNEKQRGQQHEKAIADRPTDQLRDHLPLPVR